MTLDYVNITIEPFAELSSNSLASRSIGDRYHGDGWGNRSGSSGAGHGGHGGRGNGQSRVGVSYGDYRRPEATGSTGGANVFPFVGGRGGGYFKVIAHDTLVVDGTISARGGDGASTRSGGGSGGGILAYCSRIHGDGEMDVGGGDGDHSAAYYGGGGAAGRITLYYRENHFLGRFLSTGGASSYEPGGPGTVYLEKVPGNNATYGHDRIDDAAHSGRERSAQSINGTKWVQNRTLYINAMGRAPRDPAANLSSSYSDYGRSGAARAWLTLIDRRESERNESDVQLEELHLYGGAQLSFLAPNDARAPVSITVGQMVGDKTGRLHIGYNQTFLSLDSFIPMDLVIYQGGLTTMQGELRVAGVTVDVDGVLKRCEKIVVVDDGAIHMKEMYDNHGRPTRVSTEFRFLYFLYFLLLGTCGQCFTWVSAEEITSILRSGTV